MQERVGSCLRKIARYRDVRELEGSGRKWSKVVGCLKEMLKLERGSETGETGRALEREVSERTLAEGRKTKMRPWSRTLPAAKAVFDCWHFS